MDGWTVWYVIWELILVIKNGMKELVFANGQLLKEIRIIWQIEANKSNAVCDFIDIQ